MLSVPTNNDFNFFWFCTASEECTQQVTVDEEATYVLEEPVTQLLNVVSVGMFKLNLELY